MSKFEFFELKSASNCDYFIQGYASTTSPDFVNDIVDTYGQKAVFNQIHNQNIKLDDDHEVWRNNDTGKFHQRPLNITPVAKVVDTKLDEKGVWIKAQLNKYHSKFESYKNQIKDGFLDAFSIAYNPTKFFHKTIDGVKHRVIQDLKIANIGITGTPINSATTFKPALKSFNIKMEDNDMKEFKSEFAELKSSVDKLIKEKQAEVKSDEGKLLSELKSSVDEIKKSNTELKSEIDELKKANAEVKSQDASVSNAEVKSQDASVSNAEVKSSVDKLINMLNTPQLKSVVNAKETKPDNTETGDRVDMMRLI